MTTLWDTTGTEVVKALAAKRRTGGAVTSGNALTLVVVVDEKFVGDAERAAAKAAAMNPCRLLVVVRRELDAPKPRLDAEVPQAVLPTGDEHEVGAPGGEAAGELGSQPGAGAGDEDGLVAVAERIHGPRVRQGTDSRWVPGLSSGSRAVTGAASTCSIEEHHDDHELDGDPARSETNGRVRPLQNARRTRKKSGQAGSVGLPRLVPFSV